MPDQETLEAYIEGGHGEEILVYFDIEKGEFIWANDKYKKISDTKVSD